MSQRPPPERALVRRERPRRASSTARRSTPRASRAPRSRPPRGRDLQLLVGARQLQPPLPRARRVGQARRAARGRPAARVPDAVPRREPHEADVDALPEPHGDGRRGVDPRLPARRRRAARRLRQDGPAQLMGAASADVPAIMVTGGPPSRPSSGDGSSARGPTCGTTPTSCARADDAARSSTSSRRPRRARSGTATRWGPRRR